MSDKSQMPEQMSSSEETFDPTDPFGLGTTDPLQSLFGNSFLSTLLPDEETPGQSCTPYTVSPGDTLWGISRRFLGKGSRYEEIYRDNREKIGDNPDLIFPDQELQVCEDPTSNVGPGEVQSAQEEDQEGAEVCPLALRELTTSEQAALDKLQALADQSMKEGKGGEAFAESIRMLSSDLRNKLLSVEDPEQLPDNLKITMAALDLWGKDPGNQWGEGSWDSEDLDMSAPEYATVDEGQYKCNAFVAEAIYQGTGQVHKAIPSKEEPGKYFPYQAEQWGDANTDIENFDVTTNPQMGAVWSNGDHTGIYLGEYNGQKIYISARDRGYDAYGTDEVQHSHGIQIKQLGEGGVYQQFNNAPKGSP